MRTDVFAKKAKAEALYELHRKYFPASLPYSYYAFELEELWLAAKYGLVIKAAETYSKEEIKRLEGKLSAYYRNLPSRNEVASMSTSELLQRNRLAHAIHDSLIEERNRGTRSGITDEFAEKKSGRKEDSRTLVIEGSRHAATEDALYGIHDAEIRQTVHSPKFQEGYKAPYTLSLFTPVEERFLGRRGYNSLSLSARKTLCDFLDEHYDKLVKGKKMRDAAMLIEKVSSLSDLEINKVLSKVRRLKGEPRTQSVLAQVNYLNAIRKK